MQNKEKCLLFDRFAGFVIRLFVVCCLLFVVCCLLFVVLGFKPTEPTKPTQLFELIEPFEHLWRLWFVVCGLLFGVWGLGFQTY